MPGTYANEDPNSGVVDRLADSFKKIVTQGAQMASPRPIRARGQQIADAVDTDGQHSDDYLAAKRRAQSTDADNASDSNQ